MDIYIIAAERTSESLVCEKHCTMKKNRQIPLYFTIQSKKTTSSLIFKRAEGGRDLDERNKENVDSMCGQNYDTRHCRKHMKKSKQEAGDSKEKASRRKVLLKSRADKKRRIIYRVRVRGYNTASPLKIEIEGGILSIAILRPANRLLLL